uniref:Tetratricopeptide repeat protein 39B n=1 Tax=Amphiprion ocellaris TaxID=80972 RepID=A0AAQ5YDL5_AMPOC
SMTPNGTKCRKQMNLSLLPLVQGHNNQASALTEHRELKQNAGDSQSGSGESPAVDLEAALKDSSAALDLFLNNRFADALALLRPWKDQSMYHATGYSSILVMQAGMTFEPKDMDAAMTSLGESLQTCQRFRKKTGIVESLTNLWYRQPVENLTEEEMHAELCYAEVLLQKAALTFLDESIIMESSLDRLKQESKPTVCFCRQMLSLLPARVLRLMEFLGFSGDREVGLSELREGAASSSLRSILSTLTLLMYHLYITVILGEQTLLQQNQTENVWTSLQAQEKFLACIASQEEWRQIHHLCYWELMWAYSFEQNWREAYRYADLLCKESKWSQAIYVYQKAAILSMLPEEEVTKLRENVVELFRQVDGLKLRIAGKSIPTEKFAAKKAQRYSSSNPVKLVVPALEMMYVWNGFTVVGKRPRLMEGILSTLEKAEEQLQEDPNPSEYHLDDQCVVQLLKGLCLRELGHLVQAEICFNHVISSESNIKHDNYLVPFTMYELGLLYKQKGDISKAITVIENAKTNYKDYNMESRLHFRIHAALNTMGSFAAKLPPSRTPA